LPFSLVLSRRWAKQGWKVKIRDRERNEVPHVTILRGVSARRLDLRTWRFMDTEPDGRLVPAALLTEIHEAAAVIEDSWNRMYPENPVDSKKGEK
jgi:hypothetical protein